MDEGVLVISDIHLGEDVLTSGPEHLSVYIRSLNRELAGFVRAHGTPISEGRQWHLIVNGDMFDFVKVSIQPSAEEAFERWSRELSEDERLRLPNTPENVVWKLTRIMEIHRPLFRELARFLLVGHRVTIVEGNHDAELYFPEVRETLIQGLVAEARKLVRREDELARYDPEELGTRMLFRPWFVASAGRYHVEHGHQYDEYCSFEYNLVPYDRRDAVELATPMSHRLLPYFSELLGDFSTHGVDTWGVGKWIRFAFSLGPRMLWALSRGYAQAMWELLGQAGRKREKELRELDKVHRVRLEELAQQSRYGFETLYNLFENRAKPAEFSLLKMMRVFYLDRFLVGIVALVAALGAFVVGGVGILVGGGVLALAGLTLWVLSATKHRAIHVTLREAAARVADETGARFVVFGHSHKPEVVNLAAEYGVGRFGEEAYYINGGSWVTREILQGEHGNGMTYVEISSEGATLKAWTGEGSEPRVLGRARASSSSTE